MFLNQLYTYVAYNLTAPIEPAVTLPLLHFGLLPHLQSTLPTKIPARFSLSRLNVRTSGHRTLSIVHPRPSWNHVPLAVVR